MPNRRQDRRLAHLPVELRRRRLVEARARGEAQQPDRLQQAQRAERIDVGGIFGRLEADRDMALRAEIIDFVRLDIAQDAGEVRPIGEVAIMEDEIPGFAVRILIDMVDAAGVQRRRTALDAMDRVALGKKKLRQVRAILTGNAGDECRLHGARRVGLN